MSIKIYDSLLKGGGKMPKKKIYKNRIKEVRKAKKFSLEEVGKAIGVGNSTISRYENGDREPSFENWKKLACFFDVSVPYLQGLTGVTDEDIAKCLNKMWLDGSGNKIWLRDYLAASNIKDDPHPSGLNDVTKSTLDYWKNHFSFLFRGKNNLQKDILEDEIKKIVKDTTRLTTFLKMNLNVNVEIPLSDAEKNDINVDSAKSNVIANTKTFVKELSYMDNLEVNQAIDKEIELLMNYKKHLNKGNDKHQ